MKKKILNILLIIVIAIVVVYFVLKDNLKESLLLVLNANLIWILASLFLVLSYSILKGHIIYKLANKFNENYSLKKGIKLQLLTNFFNAITPFSTGGQPFQVYMLKKEKLKLNEATGVIVSETIIHQIGLITVGIVSLIINHFLKISDSLIVDLVLVGLLANFLVLLSLILISFVKKFNYFVLNKGINMLNKAHIIKDKETTLNKWKESITSYNHSFKKLISNKKETIMLILCNILAFLAFYSVPLTVLFSLNNYTVLNGLEVIVLTSFVALIGSFIPLPGGSGGQEYAFVTLFGSYIANPLLGTLMLIWRFLTYYLPMIVGSIILSLRKDKV